MNELDHNVILAMRRGESRLTLGSDVSSSESGLLRSADLLNQSIGSDDLESLDMPDPEFEYLSEAEESGYCSSNDRLQSAVDRAFVAGFNEALDHMEHEIDELEGEDWIHGGISNQELVDSFEFELAVDRTLDDIASLLPFGCREKNFDLIDDDPQQNPSLSHKRALFRCFPLPEYWDMEYGCYEKSHSERLSAGGSKRSRKSSRSCSPSIRRRRRRTINYPGLRFGLSIQDELKGAASNPRESPSFYQRNHRETFLRPLLPSYPNDSLFPIRPCQRARSRRRRRSSSSYRRYGSIGVPAKRQRYDEGQLTSSGRTIEEPIEISYIPSPGIYPRELENRLRTASWRRTLRQRYPHGRRPLRRLRKRPYPQYLQDGRWRRIAHGRVTRCRTIR